MVKKGGQYLPENADLEDLIEASEFKKKQQSNSKTVVNKQKAKGMDLLQDLSSLNIQNNLDSHGTSELMYTHQQQQNQEQQDQLDILM